MAGEKTELRCALRDADSTRIESPGIKSKGDTEILNDQVVFYLDDAIDGALVAICYEAKKALFPKTAGLQINAGDRVYWNEVNKAVTKTNTDRAIGWGISRDDNAGIAGRTSDSDVYVAFRNEIESTSY